MNQPSASPSIDPSQLVVGTDPESLAFWSCLFDVSTERIAQAVAQVGGDVHAVDNHLRRVKLVRAAETVRAANPVDHGIAV